MTPTYETPYIYNKNYFQNYTSAVPLAGSSEPYIDSIKSDGDSDFFARRALNVYNFQDQDGNYFISGLQPSAAIGWVSQGQDFPLAPEKLYQLGADIPISSQQSSGQYANQFTLTYPGVTTAYVAVGCPLFQGVKRRKGVAQADPGYKFYERPFIYTLPFNLNWNYLIGPTYTAFNVSQLQTFFVQVLDYDFELWAIHCDFDYNNRSGAHAGAKGYMIRMYDSNAYPLMKNPVHFRYLSYNGGYAGDNPPAITVPGDTLNMYPNCFPCPPVVYQKGASIQVDIQSLLDTASGGQGTTSIQFRGVRRIPC